MTQSSSYVSGNLRSAAKLAWISASSATFMAPKRSQSTEQQRCALVLQIVWESCEDVTPQQDSLSGVISCPFGLQQLT